MKVLWYVAQAAFIGWFTYGVWAQNPGMTPGQIMIQFGISVCLCAFLTACLTRLWDWSVRRLRGLKGHRGEAGGDSLSLTGAGRSLSKTPKHAERIRVGE